MKTTSVISKFEKFTGIRMVLMRHTRTYHAQNGRKAISFIDQDGEAVCLKVRGVNDHDDMSSDYFAGSFYGTAKSAIEAFNN